MSQDYIMGKNPIIEALKSERDINKILIAEGSQRGQMQQITQWQRKPMYSYNLYRRKNLMEW